MEKKIHVLENECLRVSVADSGAELISVFDKEMNQERIWTADPAVWNRHSPILFPFVGKVVDGRYRINGNEYSMKTQHGFARDLEFDCVGESSGQISHCLGASAFTKEIYPYDFKLTVQHILLPERPRELKITWLVENVGTERMYFSIGGHPGFLMKEGTKKEDCFLVFPGKKELDYFPANDAGFALPDELHHLHLENECAHYQEDIPSTWIFESQGIDSVGIATPDGKPFVTLHCEHFPMLAVWANPKGPFICLEPWYGRTDNAGFTGTLEQKRGIEVLEGGETKEISYTIEFHK